MLCFVKIVCEISFQSIFGNAFMIFGPMATLAAGSERDIILQVTHCISELADADFLKQIFAKHVAEEFIQEQSSHTNLVWHWTLFCVLIVDSGSW